MRKLGFYIKHCSKKYTLAHKLLVTKVVEINKIREFLDQHKSGYWTCDNVNHQWEFTDYNLRFGKYNFEQGFFYIPVKLPYTDELEMEVVPHQDPFELEVARIRSQDRPWKPFHLF